MYPPIQTLLQKTSFVHLKIVLMYNPFITEIFSPQFSYSLTMVSCSKNKIAGLVSQIAQMQHQNVRLVQRRQTTAFPKTQKSVNTFLGTRIIKIVFLGAEKAILKNNQRY